MLQFWVERRSCLYGKNGGNGEKDLIKETARLYRSIAQNSMDGFWMVDIKGQFLDVNDAYCRLIGYSQSELLRMNVADVEAKEKPRNVAKRIGRMKKTGKDRFFTQHRKKDGKIIDIEVSANYTKSFGGLIFVYLRDYTEKNIAQREYYKKQGESRRRIEGQLEESYKHLGIINRKISLLFELSQYPKSKNNRQKTLDHILDLAMTLSDAPTGYLYQSKGRGKFDLLSSKGLNGGEIGKIKMISVRTVKLLRHLMKEKKLISGDIRRYEAELLVLDNKLKYFVTLPLSKGTGLGGFIFLGFDKKKSVEAQDLEFLDVFAMHASNALSLAGILK